MIRTRFSKFLTSASSTKNAPPPLHSEVAFLGRSNVGKSTLINEILESNLAKSSSTPGKTKLINFFTTQWVRDCNRVQAKSSTEQKADFIKSISKSSVDFAKTDAKSGVESQPKSALDFGCESSVNFSEKSSTDSSVDYPQVLEFCLIDLPGIGYAKVSKTELKQWQQNLWRFINERKSIKLFLHLIDSRHTDLAIDFALKNSILSLLNADQQYLQVFTKADKLSKNDLAKLHQKNSQNNAIIMAYNDKIPKKYGGKEVLREAIFDGVLGICASSKKGADLKISPKISPPKISTQKI
ncbi:GTP-binding protein [Helicobacter sp. MIT 01-3238]|uniref:GTP-binding protein n=1 Tax=Helicobacter sp. MIT 01-3238 TaxID=398627 RepID=UPI000E3A257C|nr:GTPase [Helicobacter sp. MIT 01-3238]RDU52352.1 hypothetical protein CQA40_07655 [Helicobacter sp. MIT 01-3238]